jgi:site-specific DNA recombinase
MLNVLLSSAQFERETTAERSAAKMRARARKGLWNGGYVPFGYDWDLFDKILRPHEEEATIVRCIFEDVIPLGSVGRVCEELNREGLRARPRVIGNEPG